MSDPHQNTGNPMESADAMEAARRNWLDAITQSMDAYMRTPAFLQAFQQQTEALVGAKAQANAALREMAHNMGLPTVHDVSGLFERLQSLEDTIVRRLDHMERRLREIEQRLDRTSAD